MVSASTIDGVCKLVDRGVIRAVGPDAATFLQGQLTNDVLTLGDDEARLAGFCSAKGRLQATFLIWKASPEEFLLACPTSILAPTLKRLSMFVMRARCKLSDASDDVVLYGVSGTAAEGRLDGAAAMRVVRRGPVAAIALADAAGVRRALVAAPTSDAAGIADAPSISIAAWQWLEVQSGIVTIDAVTVDRFVPQMVNFELVGGVDFKKGCYPGQEVVARSQYRGTTRRRTFLFDCDSTPKAGQDVFVAGDSGEAAGTVANAAARPDGTGGSALVEVRLAALGGELRLGSPDGPQLRRAELGYAVSLEAEPAA